MAIQSILLAVMDPQMLVEITQALGTEWELTSVGSEADALAQFEKRSFDALLVDFNLASPDASDLLNLASEMYPDTVRFLLAHEADLALVAAKVVESAHILPKPIEPVSLKSRIEEGVKETNDERTGSEPAKTPSAAPAIPSVYSEVLKALESPDVTSEQIGEIIARDAVLTSEVMSLTNSSYLGLPRNISSPAKAVESLGLEAVKVAVMALRYLAEHSRLKPGYLSLNQIWQHSINVGQIARDLTLFETKDRALASQALIAGLLHDLGKVVLATNFDDLYGRVHSLARKQPVAIWEVEKEMFGANHGEIGACLVGMWNVPSAIVEAVALHHEPPLGEHEQLTPLAAVHIANVLERELWLAGEDMMVAPVINTTFLNQLGLLQRLPIWRAAFRNRKSVNLAPELESAEADQAASPVLLSAPPSRTGNHLPAPVAATQSGTSGEPQPGEGTSAVRPARNHGTWFYAGAAGILAMLVLWFIFEPDPKRPELAYARTPASTPSAQKVPAALSPVPSPETAPVAATEVATEVTPAISEKPPAPAASSAHARSAPANSSAPDPSENAPEPAVSLPAPKPAVAMAPVAMAPGQTLTNVPPPSAAPEPKALPSFRLNGIIYTTVWPSAIVNGQTVHLGDEVDGATVVGIERATVTLQINGQRKIYTLR